MNKKILLISLIFIIAIFGLLIIINADKKTDVKNYIDPVCTEELKPVCGNDGKTYNNTCKAFASGVGIEKDAACEILANELSEESIKNTTYTIVAYNKRIKLNNGSFSETNDDETIFAAGIADDKFAFGDIDNDGINDAAVVVYSNGGGSGVFEELAIILNDFGEPVYWTSIFLEDRIKVNNISIKDRIIILDLVAHGEDDPMCCPTVPKIMKFKLEGTKLIEQ